MCMCDKVFEGLRYHLMHFFKFALCTSWQILVTTIVVLFGSVMYIADLHRAIYYQKCYDPDCKGMVHFTLW